MEWGGGVILVVVALNGSVDIGNRNILFLFKRSICNIEYLQIIDYDHDNDNDNDDYYNYDYRYYGSMSFSLRLEE